MSVNVAALRISLQKIKSKNIILTPRPTNSQVTTSQSRARSETPVGTVQPFTTKIRQIKVKAKSDEEIATKSLQRNKGSKTRKSTKELLHPSPGVTVTLSSSPATESSYVRTPTLSQGSQPKNSEATLRVQYKNYELTPDGTVAKTTCPPPTLTTFGGV